jgi:hypothetical protein
MGTLPVAGDEVSRASSEDYSSITHFPEDVLNSLILISEWLCNNDKVVYPPASRSLKTIRTEKLMLSWEYHT